MVNESEKAYSRHLERTQSAESREDIQEGLEEWFDAALPKARGKVLDFGCGCGHAVEYFRRKAFQEVEAFDINPAFGEGLGGKCTFHHDPDPGKFLKAKKEAYDLIFLKDVLEHVSTDKIPEFLTQLQESLRPGGSLLVCVPHAVSFIGLYQRYEDFTHTTLFTKPSLLYLLDSVGYEEIRFFGPRFHFKWSPKTIIYRMIKGCWHLCLKTIYFIENPRSPNAPPHFHPRLVVRARRPE